MEEKENFYHELDHHRKRSFCTCQTLAIGVCLTAFLLVGFIVWGAKKITTLVSPSRQVTSTSQDASNLQQKYSELTTQPGASTSIMVTEQELTAILVDAIHKNPDWPIRDVQATIHPEAIIVTGLLTRTVKSTLAVSIVPKVLDQVPVFELVKIQAGTLALPDMITHQLSQMLQDLLAESLTTDAISLKSINLTEGRLTVNGIIQETTE